MKIDAPAALLNGGFTCPNLNYSQPFVVGPQRRVALAGGFSETFQIKDLDVTAAVTDVICLLQHMGDE
jgi:hypothetical protein